MTLPAEPCSVRWGSRSPGPSWSVMRLRHQGRRSLGNLRLLRHADRLEPRDPHGARAHLRRRAGAQAARALPRARAGARVRAVPQLPRGADARARAARAGRADPDARGRGGRSGSLAAGLAAVSRGSRAPSPSSARAAGVLAHPLEHRPRPDRRLAAAARRADRPRDRRRGRQLVQARPRALGALLRGDDGASASATSTSRRASSTTSRRPASWACAPSGSTASASRPSPSPTGSFRDLSALPDTLDELVPA